MNIRMLSKRMLFIPAIALGVVILIVLVKSRGVPERKPVAERATPARVMTVQKYEVVPRVVGYGYVQAGQQWDAVAEVAGRIVETHPSLDKGAIIPKGELIVRIDPAKRLTAREQSSADVQNLLAQLSELNQKQIDTKSSLGVEQQSLELYRKELTRMERLFGSGTVSRSEVDTAERQVLTQQNKVQSILTTLNALPAERQALQAQIRASKSRLQEADLDLAKTAITAPFDCRVTAVNVEKGQAVNTGQVLVQADSMNLSEAVAQMPLYLFRHVIPQNGSPISTNGGKLDSDAMRKFMNLKALIRFKLGSDDVTWSGRVSRLNDSIDAKTRTLAVYVAVDEPYMEMKPGKRPPLIPNMFCEVELQGHPLEPIVVVPRSAVRGNVVFVVDKESRLARRTVNIAFSQGNITVIESGLEEGETIVLSDLVPAIDGMLIEAKDDPQSVTTLAAEAAGEGVVR